MVLRLLLRAPGDVFIPRTLLRQSCHIHPYEPSLISIQTCWTFRLCIHFFLSIFQIPPYFLVGACQVSELVQEHSNMYGNLIYFEDLQVAAKSLAMSQSQVVATRLYETSFLHRNTVDFPFLQKNTGY